MIDATSIAAPFRTPVQAVESPAMCVTCGAELVLADLQVQTLADDGRVDFTHGNQCGPVTVAVLTGSATVVRRTQGAQWRSMLDAVVTARLVALGARTFPELKAALRGHASASATSLRESLRRLEADGVVVVSCPGRPHRLRYAVKVMAVTGKVCP